MTVPRVMCPEQVEAAAHDAAVHMTAELELLNARFRTEYPDDGASSGVGGHRAAPRKDRLRTDSSIEGLRNTIARLIAYDVMVVPVLIDSKPWNKKEDLSHAVARFGLLINDLADRFPPLLDESRHDAWKLLTERCAELQVLLQSFGILARVDHTCRMLNDSERELRGLEEWVQDNPEVDVRKRLTAMQESVQAWSHQELKHLDSIAHAGQIRGC